jgi:hypothetical protein
VYVGGGGGGGNGTYNKHKLNSSNELENSVNSVNETISSDLLITNTVDAVDTHDIIKTTNISNSE